jgi:hypothetical protein
VLLESLTLAELTRVSGWQIKPQGLCRDDECLPLPAEHTVAAIAERLRMPLVADADAGLWALGPPAHANIIGSASAPDLVLPDLDGNPFHLSSLRGQKVLLLAWASW